MPYGAAVNPLAVLLRPRSAFVTLAESPRLGYGLLAVLASGAASLVLGVVANALIGGDASGAVVAASLPALFLAYWLLEGWLVDAGAGMLGRSGRRRTYLAVSGFAFPAWVAYALLSLVESAFIHAGGGAGAAIASALAWTTLPVLAWFVVLTVLAIRAVYGVPLLNALALALLPYAMLTAALLVLGIALGALRAAGVA